MTDVSGSSATADGQKESTSSGAEEKAREMKGQAEEKAQNAVGKAQDSVREQLNSRSTEAGEKVASTAGDLRSVGEELRNQGKDTPAKLADQAAERTEQVGSYLRESDADKLLEDIESFGRRQPLAVLAGGLVVGIAAARFLKASSRGRYQARTGSRGPTPQLQAPTSVSGQARERSGQGLAPTPAGMATPQVPVPSDPALR
jgi:hypothetical protein